MNTLTWVDEVQPSLTGDPGDPTIEFYDGDLTKPMVDLLKRVANEPDEWSCQANGCGFGGDRGASAVGYVLYEPEEPGDLGGLVWHWTTVVQHGDKVMVVCEDCTPSTVYDRLV